MNARKLVKLFIPTRLFRLVAPWGHLAEGIIFNCLYGFPAKGMKVIGVTGTNGKTTTCFLIHRMLQESGKKVGLITTVAWGIGGEVWPQAEHMTNVPVPLLMKRLKQMKAQGVKWLVLETTSHALAQHRTFGVPYSVAVLTNITREHLDYHRTMEHYAAAKQRLFKLVQKNKRGLRMGIVNADDPSAADFADITDNTLLYGVGEGDVQAKSISLGASSIRYDAKVLGETYHITCKLPGSFNVYNSLAAVSVGYAVGLSKKEIERGIAALPGVAGRMEPVYGGQPFTVVVDYAHTPDALENVLRALKGSTKGKLRLVFGATGDRDKGKREPMGEEAARLADKIYLTDDETYTEDPLVIREAVLHGIVAAGGSPKVTVVPDRLDAIKTAFKEAKAGDTVLLAGMGHQDYRVMGGQKLPWDERDVARDVLKKLH